MEEQNRQEVEEQNRQADEQRKQECTVESGRQLRRTMVEDGQKSKAMYVAEKEAAEGGCRHARW